MKKLILFSALTFLFSSLLCNSAVAQKKYAEEMKFAAETQAEWYERSLPLLSKKIPAHPKKTSLAQLADPSKANKIEKEELHLLVEKRKEYLSLQTEIAINYVRTPGLGYAYAEELTQYTSKLNSLSEELYSGKITFGEYNKKRIELANESSAKMTEAFRIYHAQALNLKLN